MKQSNINLNFPAKIEFKWQVTTLFLMFGESRMSSASGVVSCSDGKQLEKMAMKQSEERNAQYQVPYLFD